MQVCKHLSMKVCKYARGHLDPEQRGRLIGKGPLPKEKLMKALGEVSSHCESFSKDKRNCYKYCQEGEHKTYCQKIPPYLLF